MGFTQAIKGHDSTLERFTIGRDFTVRAIVIGRAHGSLLIGLARPTLLLRRAEHCKPEHKFSVFTVRPPGPPMTFHPITAARLSQPVYSRSFGPLIAAHHYRLPPGDLHSAPLAGRPQKRRVQRVSAIRRCAKRAQRPMGNSRTDAPFAFLKWIFDARKAQIRVGDHIASRKIEVR